MDWMGESSSSGPGCVTDQVIAEHTEQLRENLRDKQLLRPTDAPGEQLWLDPPGRLRHANNRRHSVG